MNRRLLTQKAYAKRIKKSAQYVNKLVSRGVIVLVNRHVDPKQADAAIREARQREERKPRRAKAVALKVARRQKVAKEDTQAFWTRENLRLKAESQEMENAARRRELLPRDQVMKAQQMKNANFRMQLRRLPRAVAALLSRMSNSSEIEAFLDDKVCELLTQLSEDPFGEKSIALPVPETVVAESLVPEISGAAAGSEAIV